MHHLQTGSLLTGTICCRIPLPFNNVAPGYIEWLYLDEDLRITKGNKGSYFIHTRC